VHFVESRYRCEAIAIDRQRLRTQSIAAAQGFVGRVLEVFEIPELPVLVHLLIRSCQLLADNYIFGPIELATAVLSLQPWLLTISCVTAVAERGGIKIKNKIVVKNICYNSILISSIAHNICKMKTSLNPLTFC